MPNPDQVKDYDEYFAMRMEYTPTVLATAASTQVSTEGPHVGTAQLGEDPLPWLYQYPGILPTESTLKEKASGIGVVTATPEIDGVTRRIPLVVSVGSKLYPSFALELLRVAVQDPSYQLKTTEEGVTWVRIPNYPLMNTDANGRIFLNWNRMVIDEILNLYPDISKAKKFLNWSPKKNFETGLKETIKYYKNNLK